MAFQKHALLAFCGSWANEDMGGEVWQFGIRLFTGEAGGWWLADPQAYLDSIASDLVDWFTSSDALMRADAQLDIIKCNNLTTAGHYADPETHQVDAGAMTGAQSTSDPAFTSLAVTWETGHTTGRARRGRIYPPNYCHADVGKGVTVSSDIMDQTVVAAGQLLSILLINEPVGGLLVRPCIVSRVDASLNDITGISVNSTIDVQRRRKNRADSSRTAVVPFP